MYAVHVHRGSSPTVPEYPHIRRKYVWLYFPLGPEEEIDALWIYSHMFKASFFTHSCRVFVANSCVDQYIIQQTIQLWRA